MSQPNKDLDNIDQHYASSNISKDVLQDWTEAKICQNKFEEDIRKIIITYQNKLEKLCAEKKVKNPLEDTQLSTDILVAVKQVQEAYTTVLNKERKADPAILSEGFLPPQETLMNIFFQCRENNKEIQKTLLAYLKRFKERSIHLDQNYLVFEKAYKDVCCILDNLNRRYGNRFFIDDQTLSQIPKDLRLAEVLIDMHLNNLLVVKNMKTAADKIVSIEVELLKPVNEITSFINPKHIEYLGISMDLPDMTNVRCNGKDIPFGPRKSYKSLSFLKMLIEAGDEGVVYNDSLLESLNITKKKNKTIGDKKKNIRDLQKERVRNIVSTLNKKIQKVNPNIKIIKNGNSHFLILTSETEPKKINKN